MKVAITCRENDRNAIVDQRFGRCVWFAIYDTETAELEFVQNTARDADGGAGPAAVAVVAGKGVAKILSGEFGPKIKQMLMELNIQMVMVKEEKTVAELIGILK